MATATQEVQGIEATFQLLDLGNITPSPLNPRKRFDEKGLKELSESIRSHGVQQPILVRPIRPRRAKGDLYEIVVGERRYKASKLAQRTHIPAIIRELSNADALEIMVIENLQREDVHPLDEALGYEALMKHKQETDPELGELPGAPAHTAESIAAKVGKSVGYVYARLKLCIQSDQEPYCQLLDPGCQDECLACGDGCCASARDNKNKCPKLKQMAFQAGEPTGTRNSNYGNNKHLKVFLDALEAGKFDGKKIVYLAEDNPILKGLMSMPANHWKTFEKRIRVQGTPERGAEVRGELNGKPQTYLYIETKTGHSATIHIDSANANNKPQSAKPTT